MGSVLKVGISWVVVLAGVALGVFGLALFASTPVLGYWSSTDAWWFAAAAAIFGLCLLFASVLAQQNRRQAGLVLLGTTPAVVISLKLSHSGIPAEALQTSTILPALCVIFGTFWLLTNNWPNIQPQVHLPLFARALSYVAMGLALIASVSVGAITLTIWEPDIGDCGEGPLNYKPYPEYPVFVVRVVHSDRILGSVAVVQERFWNLRHRTKVVFLKALWKPGDVYFVAGRLGGGLLTSWIFPVINMHCSRSGPIQYATVDLRALRAERPKSTVRIIGNVEKRGKYGQSTPGVKVLIKGPKGTLTVTTDKDGIYDVSGLAPGHYEVHPENDTDRAYQWCEGIDLVSGDIGGCTLRVN